MSTLASKSYVDAKAGSKPGVFSHEVTLAAQSAIDISSGVAVSTTLGTITSDSQLESDKQYLVTLEVKNFAISGLATSASDCVLDVDMLIDDESTGNGTAVAYRLGTSSAVLDKYNFKMSRLMDGSDFIGKAIKLSTNGNAAITGAELSTLAGTAYLTFEEIDETVLS